MSGAGLIAAERQRQIEKEGWTPEHDDQHGNGVLVEAAVAYARYGHDPRFVHPNGPPSCWPWDADWWKPASRLRSLVKAGALIAAEIDRLQRRDKPPTCIECGSTEDITDNLCITCIPF